MKKNASKIGIFEKFSFAVGEIYGSGGVAILSLLYLWFLINIIKIPAGMAGTIIMLARFWDAFTDPIMGSISDNTRTKWGRRIPYIFASGILIVIALFVLFMPIQGWTSLAGKVAYVVFAHLFYSTVSTIFNVPYLSLSSEISENLKERNSMNFVRLAMGMLSTAVCYLVISALKDMLIVDEVTGVAKLTETQFALIVAGIFAVMFAVPILLTALFCKERTPLPNEKLKFSFKNILETFKLKCFRRLLLMYVFSFVCNEIIANVIMMYVFNVTGGSSIKIAGFSLSAIANMSMLLGAAVIMPVSFTMLQKKVAKPVIFMCGIPMFVIGAIGLAAFPTNTSMPALIILPLAIAGIGFGMAQMIPWLVFPDVCDVAELKSNDRNPGAYNSTMTFFKKFASGVAVLIVGWVLQGFGYDEQLGTNALQPQSAILGMRLILGISIPLCLIVAFVGAYMIKITTKKSERVRYFVEKQRNNELENLCEEEKSELETLKKELF